MDSIYVLMKDFALYIFFGLRIYGDLEKQKLKWLYFKVNYTFACINDCLRSFLFI